MADFDPATRHETWLFVRTPDSRPGPNRDKVMRRLPFNIVHYDGIPDGFIEPRSLSDQYTIGADGSIDIVNPSDSDATGRVTRIEVHDVAPYADVHAFGFGTRE